MKAEMLIAVAALPVSLATGLGSAWVSVGAAKRLQEAKYEREDRAAEDEALSEMLLAATQFSLSCHVFHIRWTEAASLVRQLTGGPQALNELAAVLGPERERLFKTALQVSRWQGADRRAVRQGAMDLVDAAGGLVEALGKRGNDYEAANQTFREALKAARQAIDAWDNPSPSRRWWKLRRGVRR
ncbi:hypothetical protein [Actinomadura geliboluensis]|uniref:hypothetical protein n=1 Tax=Actinomadura geliboluensis TaxID=882440 RepID=UPI0036CA9415